MTVEPAMREAAGRRRSDLATRVLSGLAMIAVALLGLVLGGLAIWVLVSAAALLMVAEWAGLMRASPMRGRLAIVAFMVPMMAAGPMLLGPTRDTVALLCAVAILVAMAGGLRLAAGLLYAGLPAIGLLYVRGFENGLLLTLWTLAIVWATDIGAYFAGRAIGGPKLAPRISPNKTWAGLGGGMAGALVIGAAIAVPARLPMMLVLAGPALAVLAQMGDLFESWLKRKAEVKDSGRLLPGHGGALDRLDGVVPVATLVAGLAAAGVIA